MYLQVCLETFYMENTTSVNANSSLLNVICCNVFPLSDTKQFTYTSKSMNKIFGQKKKL